MYAVPDPAIPVKASWNAIPQCPKKLLFDAYLVQICPILLIFGSILPNFSPISVVHQKVPWVLSWASVKIFAKESPCVRSEHWESKITFVCTSVFSGFPSTYSKKYTFTTSTSENRLCSLIKSWMKVTFLCFFPLSAVFYFLHKSATRTNLQPTLISWPLLIGRFF